MSDLKPVQKLTYKIMAAEDIETLSVAVTQEMKLGWELQGGVAILYPARSDPDDNRVHFMQAMIKTESALS